MPHAINPLIVRLVACLTGLCVLSIGCGKQPDPPEPKVITRKITVPKAATEEGKLSPPAERVAAIIKSVTAEDVSPKEASAGIDPPRDPATSVGQETGPEVEPASKPIEVVYSYDPKGKIDPFIPWYEGERKPASDSERKRIPLSPLERVDLSQLKLVGIVLSASGNKALVEESSGKGYVISKGTYIGLNRGKVSKILRDRVIIMESISYGGSSATTRRKELKLQKPPGED